MTLTPTGNVSLKPRQGRSWKRARRIEIVARLEAQFIPDADIARHLGLTVQALHHIKISPEYIAKRTALATGVLSVYDNARLASEEAQKEELSELVPAALNAVRTVLSDKMHPQFSRVAMDVLDRNRHTSKISRTQHSIDKPFDTSLQDAQALELLALLGEPVPVTIEAKLEAPAMLGVLEVQAEKAVEDLNTEKIEEENANGIEEDAI